MPIPIICPAPVTSTLVAVSAPAFVTLKAELAPSASPSVPKYNPVFESVNVALLPNVIFGVEGSSKIFVADSVEPIVNPPIVPELDVTSPSIVTFPLEAIEKLVV